MALRPNYSEETGYVNIHGQDVRVFQCEMTGRILVPIDELKDIGFRIYRKSQFSRLLIDDDQFSKEFDMYMLQSAQSYMLQNRIVFKENEILESINKCKMALNNYEGVTSKDSSTPATKSPMTNNFNHTNTSFNESPLENSSPRNVFSKSPENITVTATLIREPTSSTIQNLQNRKSTGFPQNKSPLSFVKSFSDKKPKEDDKPNFENQKFRNDRNSFSSDRSSSDHKDKNSPNGSFEQKKDSPSGSVNSLGKTNGFPDPKGTRRNQDEEVERLPTIELNKPEHNVVITYLDPEKPNITFVQDADNADILLNIDMEIKNAISKNPTKVNRAIWNRIYLGLDPTDGVWYRCRVIKFKPVLIVVFVDYGNTAETSDLREAPEELHHIAAQVVKVIFTNNANYKPQLYDNVLIKIKQKYEVGSYLVEHITKESPSPPRAVPEPTPKKAQPPAIPTFFTKPQPLVKLEDGQRVMIIGSISGRLAVRTRECHEKLKQVEKALEELDATKVKPVEKIDKGQLVLCKENGKLQRALVLEVQRNNAQIEFLDFCKKIKVDVSSLMHINESLARQPLTFVVTPEIKGYDSSAEEAFKKLGEESVKATVVLSGGEVDLKLGEELLSEKISPKHSDRPMLKDFEVYKPRKGLGEFTMNIYCNSGELYLASADALGEYLEHVLITELKDDQPYEPIVGEVCLGNYQESWSRCAVLSTKNSRHEVRFVDFGNVEFLKSEDCRKLPEECKETPVLAFHCRLTGLPKTAGNIEDVLKKKFENADNFEINVKECNAGIYEIEVPAVYNSLI